MSYHIINIDTPEAYITCRNGQLICDDGKGSKKSLPLEDVAAIVVTSFSSTVHSQVLIAAAELGVSLIFCKSFKPISLVLPANRSSDTALTKAFVQLQRKELDALWQKTIDAKCDNQLFFANLMSPKNEKLSGMITATRRTTPEKESTCARYYWQIFAQAINNNDFRRNAEMFLVNALLDFGYSSLP
jgi:Uncharacterized protein predicted to be involved in DNA repair